VLMSEATRQILRAADRIPQCYSPLQLACVATSRGCARSCAITTQPVDGSEVKTHPCRFLVLSGGVAIATRDSAERDHTLGSLSTAVPTPMTWWARQRKT